MVNGLQFYKLSITLESMYSAYTSLWFYYEIIIHVTIISHIAVGSTPEILAICV